MLANTTSSLSNPAGEIGQMAAELAQMWSLLVVAVAIAVVMGFVYLILVRLIAKCMMFFTLFGLLLVLALCSLFAWDKTGKIHIFASVINTTGVNASALPGVGNALKTPTEPAITYAVAVILSVATVAYAALLCVMLKRLIIAIDVIQEAAKSMAAMPALLLLPLSTFLALLFLYLWAGFISIYLLSGGQFDPITGKFVFAGGDCSSDLQSININISQPTVIVTLAGLSALTPRSLTIQSPALLLSDTPSSASLPVGGCLGYWGPGLAANCSTAAALKSAYFAGATGAGTPGTVGWSPQLGAITLALPAGRAAWPAGSLRFSVNLHRPNGSWQLAGAFADGSQWALQSATVVSGLRGLDYADASRFCNLYGSTGPAKAGARVAEAAALAASGLSDVNELPAASFLSGASLGNWRSLLPVTLDGTTYNYFVIYHLFMFLWNNAFLAASGFYVTCGAVAGWYWAEDKRSLGRLPVLSSAWRYARYNVGTVLVGSFILAVVQLIRILFNYYVRQCNKFKDNPVVKATVCIVNCCLWCLEKVGGAAPSTAPRPSLPARAFPSPRAPFRACPRLSRACPASRARVSRLRRLRTSRRRPPRARARAR